MSFEYSLLESKFCRCFHELLLVSIQSLSLFLHLQHSIVLEIEVSCGDTSF
jgi:hypothetical protein